MNFEKYNIEYRVKSTCLAKEFGISHTKLMSEIRGQRKYLMFGGDIIYGRIVNQVCRVVSGCKLNRNQVSYMAFHFSVRKQNEKASEMLKQWRADNNNALPPLSNHNLKGIYNGESN